jgi:hypothetical protein
MLLWIFAAFAVVSIIILLTVVLLDLAKQERHRRALDDSVLTVLAAGLTAIAAGTKQNIQALARGNAGPDALQTLSLDYWTLVVAQPPKRLVSTHLLATVAEATHAAQQLNSLVDARELCRSSADEGMDVRERISALDEEIRRDAKALLTRIETLSADVEAIK